MSQEENKKLLLELHHIITGTQKTCEQIISKRTVRPDIIFIRKTGFKAPISVRDYYPLGGGVAST
jgi:hypothetical protein